MHWSLINASHLLGGSIFLHAFACYYGLAACAVLYNPDQETSKNLSVSHTTDLFAVGGTLMLWCIWPSFNSGLLLGDIFGEFGKLTIFVVLCGFGMNKNTEMSKIIFSSCILFI